MFHFRKGEKEAEPEVYLYMGKAVVVVTRIKYKRRWAGPGYESGRPVAALTPFKNRLEEFYPSLMTFHQGCSILKLVVGMVLLKSWNQVGLLIGY